VLILGSTLALLAQDTAAHAAKSVTIHVDGSERSINTTKDTVQTVLHQEHISLGDHDLITPPLATLVTDGMTITIARVTCEITYERYTIPAPTITRFNRRMTVKPVVVRAGKPGVGEMTRVTWKKDGVVSETWTQSPRTVTRPVPTMVLRGNLPSRGERRVLRMVATAYDPGPLSCGRRATGHTAIGMHAGRGVIAVDPRVIPLGTRVHVEGYGYAIAADTGGAIRGHKIDVCFPTRYQALRWGRRTVTVTILD
jgi:3D (Asp-Asp-Asp) domain-containing protein